MTSLSTATTNMAFREKELAIKISNCLRDRFADQYTSSILNAMRWYDPINWNPDDRKDGIQEIEKLYQHFKSTLDAAQFSHVQAVKEWVSFRRYVSTSLPNHTADRLWSSTFKFKKRVPKPRILAELIIAISG